MFISSAFYKLKLFLKLIFNLAAILRTISTSKHFWAMCAEFNAGLPYL
jgi:hypothetical protein